MARISGAASRLAAALSTSPAARAGGKFLGAATGGYGLFNAGEQALTETVPYGAAAGGGERRRFAPPAWLASRLPEDMQPVRCNTRTVCATEPACSAQQPAESNLAWESGLICALTTHLCCPTVCRSTQLPCLNCRH